MSWLNPFSFIIIPCSWWGHLVLTGKVPRELHHAEDGSPLMVSHPLSPAVKGIQACLTCSLMSGQPRQLVKRVMGRGCCWVESDGLLRNYQEMPASDWREAYGLEIMYIIYSEFLKSQQSLEDHSLVQLCGPYKWFQEHISSLGVRLGERDLFIHSNNKNFMNAKHC